MGWFPEWVWLVIAEIIEGGPGLEGRARGSDRFAKVF